MGWTGCGWVRGLRVRVAGGVAVVVVAAGLVAAVPAQGAVAAAGGAVRPPAPGSAAAAALRARFHLGSGVAETLVGGRHAAARAARVPVQDRAARPAAPAWPAAGSAAVSVAAAPAGAGAAGAGAAGAAGAPAGAGAGSGSGSVPAGGWSAAGGLPVAVAGVAAGAGQVAVSRVRVAVAGHAVAAAAGVAGAVVAVSRADGAGRAGRVRVRVSYGGFASAFGGGYGPSLELFTMAGCALSAPGRRGCAGMTPVATVNDAAARTVSAVVTVPASGQVVVAASPTPSGGTGDFRATSLAASSQAQVGLQAGDFQWSYPLRVPPPIGGAAPSLSLSYDSGVTDGETAQGNSQPGQVGEGFSVAGAGGFIERRYVSCGDLISGVVKGSVNNTGQAAATGDQCYDGFNADLSLGGHSGEIIYDPSAKAWRLSGDAGSTVNFLHGAVNGAWGQSYWEVIEPDGTQFWFGLGQLPGWQAGDPVTNSVWTEPVVGLGAGDPCNTPGSYAGSVCANMPYRWNLDLVVDPDGNATSYFYNRETNDYLFGSTTGNDGTKMAYTSGGTLSRIDYGSQDNAASGNDVYARMPLTVSFGYSDRCTVTDGSGNVDGATCDGDHASMADWPDVPWYLSCAASGACSGPAHYAPAFFDTRMLTSVTTSAFEGSNPQQQVDTWDLGYTWQASDVGADLTLTKITHQGDVGGTRALAPVQLGYGEGCLPNRVQYDTTFPAMIRCRRT